MLIATQSVPMRYLSYWSDRAYRRDGRDRSDGTYGRDRNRRDWCNGPHRCNGAYRRHRRDWCNGSHRCNGTYRRHGRDRCYRYGGYAAFVGIFYAECARYGGQCAAV